MTLTIQFADGTTQAALTDTTVYPSGSQYARSYAEIHLEESAMSLDEFEALFKNEDKTKKMHFILKNDDAIVADEIYENFILLMECGKKMCTIVDSQTGVPTESMHLFVRLEQLTYIEQKLHEAGLI